jgi:uncharacterized Zn finger protein
MKNWEHFFQSHILDRGWDYYQTDCVQEISEIKDGYRAVVTGTTPYEVEIEYEQGAIASLFCTCPHAEGGSHCKHMAAVLYQIEEMTS